MPLVKQSQIPSWSWMAQQSNVSHSNDDFAPRAFPAFDQKPAFFAELNPSFMGYMPYQPFTNNGFGTGLTSVGLPNGLPTPTGFHQNSTSFHMLPYANENTQLEHHLESFPNLS
ncbi:hypothetical protein DICVIV_02727 [Dictyocaulus viviparus]|uniref:Uncharacterized protein n=1 Tax=Dictyocaulus viviparus TaxID=29172 RepID=A0A0D8Y2W6_DICVI|nr:hypothetical protein DICVIV_02727 [Dictyocaulus viviparus]